MRLKNGTIALVTDGSKMLLLRNEGDTVFPDFRVIDHDGVMTMPNRDLVSDAPGVTHFARHGGRSTYGSDDPHRRAEMKFAEAAADALAQAAEAHGGELIVVAPPQSLAVLRRHYGRTIRSRLVAEIDKDLTKHPIAEITRLVVAHEPPLSERGLG